MKTNYCSDSGDFHCVHRHLLKYSASLTGLVLLVLGTISHASAQNIIPAPHACSLEELAQLPWCELEALYRQAAPGQIPVGSVRGKSFLPPGKFLGGPRSHMINTVWQGKQFYQHGGIINQWCVGQAIRGEVYYGTSWLDGKPSMIIDYKCTSRIWADARDEFREVAPGLYVGIMHLRRCPCPVMKTYFVLQSQPGCGDCCEP